MRQVVRLQELGMNFVISTGKGESNKIQNNNEHPTGTNTDGLLGRNAISSIA
jgi:hypothetical protein